MNVRDLAAAVKTSLGEHVDSHDVDGIVEEVGNTYGYDIASIDDVPATEYWAIVERHGR